MLPASDAYLTEEAKLRGAIPTCRAMVNPGTYEAEVSPAEIIRPGRIVNSIPRQFQGLSPINYHLLVCNRNKRWLWGTTGSPGKVTDKLRLDHGFQLADTSKVWVSLFTGSIKKISNQENEFGRPHTAVLEIESLISQRLREKIGVPAADGTRQPYMHGPYMANAEFDEKVDPYLSTITKTGTGSAVIHIVNVDEYYHDENLNIRIQAEGTGEVGTVTFKYSIDGGSTWEKTGILTKNITSPVNLVHGLKVYWTSGLNDDFVSGDRWDFTVYTQVYKYKIPGAPFQDITAVYKNSEPLLTGFTKNITTGEIQLTGTSGGIKARVLKNLTVHPVDIIQDILTTVDLDSYIHTLSFAEAKSDTLEYQIGVRFENVEAGKAIQIITQSCLYFLWEDSGLLHLQAYTGNLL